MASTRVFASKQVVLDSDQPEPATIVVDVASGKIIDVLRAVHSKSSAPPSIPADAEWIDAGEHAILPGLVDAHVHINEPGRTDWEGFHTGTRAAASGGVTTLVDMPLNSIPPTTTVAHFDEKRAAARGQCWVDVAFWGGVIPGNHRHLRPLVNAGVKGFKCFLIESGVEEFPHVTEPDLIAAMGELKDTSTVLCFHAELEEKPHAHTDGDPTKYSTFLASRPDELEIAALRLITRLHASYPSLRLHIVHLSAAPALPLVRAAQRASLPLTAETCFHYLTLEATAIPDGRPEFKCCPPVRGAANRDALWDALKDGTLSCVVSDHSPCVASLKCLDEGDIMRAWGGINTLGLGLSLLWTEAQKRGVGLREIVRWCCKNTALHAGLAARKGRIAPGWDADLVFWDPSGEFTVTAEGLNFKNKLSPYVGMTLRGVVEQTFVRGQLVYSRAQRFVAEPAGELL